MFQDGSEIIIILITHKIIRVQTINTAISELDRKLVCLTLIKTVYKKAKTHLNAEELNRILPTYAYCIFSIFTQ